MSRNTAIILAGGMGSRMNIDTPKAFIKLQQKYLIEYSIIQFEKNNLIDEILLIVPKEYLKLSVETIKTNYSKITKVLKGGKSRYQSSCIGVNAVEQTNSKVLIHDAARPFVSQKMIRESIKALDNFDAINILAPITDTLIQLENNEFSHLLDRSQIRKSQTPQSFNYHTIKKAQEFAKELPDKQITDDFGLVNQYNTGSTAWIEGSQMNFKITNQDDLEFANKILAGFK